MTDAVKPSVPTVWRNGARPDWPESEQNSSLRHLSADGKKVAEGALPLLAQLGPSAMSAIGSLSGAKRTLSKPHPRCSIYEYTP